MTTFDTQPLNGEYLSDYETSPVGSGPVLYSPFARNDLTVASESLDGYPSLAELTSPFTESFTTVDEVDMNVELGEMLLAELDDREFNEALEALAQEAAGRYMHGTAGWNQESGMPVVDPTEAEQWMEAIAFQADQLLAELEERFIDRSAESVTEAELDEVLNRGFPQLSGFSDPLDAQELFFGALKRKLKSVAKAVTGVVKKGVSLAKKFLPLGLIYRALRPIIKPLLRKVLAKAIGKLPKSLQEPARKLAQKYGLRPASEFENEFEYFGTEFDMLITEALTAQDSYGFEALEAELAAEEQLDGNAGNPTEQLDVARERLTQALLGAQEGDSPVEAMEQFLPVVMAAMPAIRMGIKVIGRRKVVNFIAGLLAKLIRPMVGPQLARPLSRQIADKGLAMLNLEQELGSDRLGAEAMVAAAEETIGEVFSMSDEWLENELLTEVAVQEAFHAAVARHFPASVLRGDTYGSGVGQDRGVWIMMPRATSPMYRYKKYSSIIPVSITRPMAREVVFSDGETLEDRFEDEGFESWPVDGEIEAYELLPGSNVGHIASFETEGEAGSHYELALEFDTLEEAGSLPLPADMERGKPSRGSRNPKVLRIRAGGRRLRRKSPVSIRLDLSGSQPAMRLHVWVGERRAHLMAGQLQKQQHREVVATFKGIASAPMRRTVAKRLQLMFGRRKINRSSAAVSTFSEQLFDAFVVAIGKQVLALAPTMASAAKDQAVGLTVTAVFAFPSKDAIAVAKPNPPTLSIRPGRHRD